MMSFGKKQMIIKDIYIHPNSDLAIFKNKEDIDLPILKSLDIKKKLFLQDTQQEILVI